MTRGFGKTKSGKNNKARSSTPPKATTIEDAVSLMQSGNLSAAISTVETLIENNPNNFRAHKILAGFELMNGNWQKAIEMSKIYLAHNPSDIESLYALGIAYQESKDIQSAINCYKSILASSPSSADTYNNLGVIMEQIGELEEAVRYFKEGLEFRFNATDPCLIKLNLAQALEYSRLLDEAAEMYGEAEEELRTAWNENSYTGLVSSMPVLLQLGNFKRAETILTTALAAKKRFRIGDKAWRNKAHDLDYLNFISKLLPLIPQQGYRLPEDSSAPARILHIGDSHCLTFTNSNCAVNAKSYRVEPCLIKGAKAWHFASQEKNRYKQSLSIIISEKTSSYDHIFLSFGEIDCRETEGISVAAEKLGLDPLKVAAETAKAYIGYMMSVFGELRSKLVVFGTPALTVARASSIKDGSRLARIQDIIKTFNSSLSEACSESGIRFIDTYQFSLGPNGLNNQKWMLDKYHFSPSVLQPLIQDFPI